MKWTGLNDLRESYLAFFESKNHTRMASASLVPKDDPSLLLINSGMAPLKNFFLGTATPPNTKVTTCQKCIRTPDIENIGKTARHGTYFEMLGNFSFGDYFKKDATLWAWEYFTEVLGIPADLLWVSIYEDDDEAFDIWTKERGVAPERVVRMGKADNFWEHGVGPCGPCSEIYFDRGESYGCDSPTCAVGCECDRYMEVWNLVFTQFDSDGQGTYTPLAKPNIDTGMGLERLACVMQGVDNLFEVDTVQNIMKHIGTIAGVTYHQNDSHDISLRVITDHVRSTTFMVGDGVIPSNEGRGYVLRRLLRRAARHGRMLGITRPFLHEVAATVITENLSAYPELLENRDYIQKVILAEEERFGKTVVQGSERLADMIEKLKTSNGTSLSGEDAFLLHDTFGFPLDLTKDVLEENGMTVDEEGFATLMKAQREKARAATGSSEAFGGEGDPLAELTTPPTEFIGYTELEGATTLLAMASEGQTVDTLISGQEAVIVLERTPFYAESGGQVGDTGKIMTANGCFEVLDCKKTPKGHFAHIGRMISGKLSKDEKVTACVDTDRRNSIMRNHSACHLLQTALREVLGDHVHQAGSMVNENQCRFDFTHFSAMTPEEILSVESLVNDMILQAAAADVREMPIEQAKELGALALFGEKYGDSVRVCRMGDKSTEFCGGTHVDNTAKIGLFKILTESSVAAGVRRIEATTGYGVLRFIRKEGELILNTAQALKVGNPIEIAGRAESVMAELREKDREIDSLNQKLAATQIQGLFENAEEIEGLKLIAATLVGAKPEALRTMGDKGRERNPHCIMIITTVNDDKGSVCVTLGPEAQKAGLHAGKLIKELLSTIGGSGGGRPDSAMGGTTEILRIDEMLTKAPEIIKNMLSEKK